jgi:hypothetical protein
MPRKSLRPNLNQIRAWVRQGRTDAWVAHQLEVSVRDIEQFKRQNDLVEEDGAEGAATPDYPDEIDLRAEDDALIAAELEAAEVEAERAKAEAAEKAAQEAAEAEERGEADGEVDEDAPKPRARRRRGGRGRRVLGSRSAGASAGALEGTFDHGEEGYGLWLDPAIQDNPVYAEHWAGHRTVEVAVEEDCIVIRRTGDD